MYSSSGQGRREGQAFMSAMGHPSATTGSNVFGSDSSALGKGGKDGGRTRLGGEPQQQSWDATTYHGLLAILEDSRAPIAASCAAVEECLSLNKDNLRGFFEECFAPLVAKIFGYSGGGYGGGWLTQVSWSSTGSRGDDGFRKDHLRKGLLMKGGKDHGGSVKKGGSSLEMSDAAALRRLLSPQGKLFMAMYNADCDGTIKFHFPRQRLPTCTQLLMDGRGLSLLALWPQYETCLNTQARAEQQHIHVSVFQYFCYWFAFYAIKGGSGVYDTSLSSSRRLLGQSGGKAGGLQTFGKRAADVLHLRSGRSGSGVSKNMYVLLLRDLLHEYLPRPIDSREDEGLLDGHSVDHGRGAVLYSSYQSKPGTGLLLYSILLEFWLKDADERLEDAALPTSGAHSIGGQRGLMTQRATWGSSYDPPPENVLEVVEELTKYIMVYQLKDENVPAQSGASWLPLSPVLCQARDVFNRKTHTSGGHKNVLQGPRILGLPGSMGCQAYGRQLYRLFHRAFSSWPDQRTIKPLLRVFLAVLAPWQVGTTSSSTSSSSTKSPYATQEGATGIKGKMSDLAHMVGLDGQKNSKTKVNYYTDEWEHHVLAHVPFYLDLVPLFLKLSVSRIGARGEASVQDVHKVMSVFEKSESLVSLLKELEQDVNKCYASQPRRADGKHAEIIPWIIDQAENWKDHATSSATRAEQKKDSVRPRTLFAMFSAEIPCAALSANDILCTTSGILKADAQKALEKCFVKTLPMTDVHAAGHEADARSAYAHELSDIMKIQKSTWMDVRFKGDVLRAPRTSYEIVYLVDLMIHLSEMLNAKIGLDVPCRDGEIPENIIQEYIYGLRRRNWRINLRPIADIRNLFWTTVLLSACIMIARLLYWSIVVAFQDV